MSCIKSTKAFALSLAGILKYFLIAFLLGLSIPYFPAQAQESSQAEHSMETDRIIVKYKSGQNFNARAMNGRILAKVKNTCSIPVSDKQNIELLMQYYRSKSDVEYVEPDYRRQACSLPQEAAALNWGIVRTNVHTLSQQVIGNSSAIAALLRVNNDEISISKIEETIYDYTDDVGPRGKDTSFGYGIINFVDYKNNQLINLDILSPLANSKHYHSLNVSYLVSGNFVGYVRFEIDGHYYSSQRILSNKNAIYYSGGGSTFWPEYIIS